MTGGHQLQQIVIGFQQIIKTALDFFTLGIKTDLIAESTSAAGVTIDGVLLKDGVVATGGTVLAATGAEINRVADVSGRVVTVTTTPLAVDEATHEGKTVVLSKVDGIAVTLPAAAGSGVKYRFVVGLTITSVGTTIKVTGNDTMKGTAFGLDDDGVPPNAWAAASDSDTITLDGSTTGGKVGDIIELEDIAADLWLVSILMQQSGTEATPFSATVT